MCHLINATYAVPHASVARSLYQSKGSVRSHGRPAGTAKKSKTFLRYHTAQNRFTMVLLVGVFCATTEGTHARRTDLLHMRTKYLRSALRVCRPRETMVGALVMVMVSLLPPQPQYTVSSERTVCSIVFSLSASCLIRRRGRSVPSFSLFFSPFDSSSSCQRFVSVYLGARVCVCAYVERIHAMSTTFTVYGDGGKSASSRTNHSTHTSKRV